MIRFACPGCSATFTVADEKAGKTGKCPKCQSQFVIPDAPAPASPPSPVASKPPALPPSPPPSPEEETGTVEVSPCPKCGARLSVLASDVGSDIECPHCQNVYRAIRSDAPPPPDTGSRSGSGSSKLVKLGSGSRRDDEDDEDDRPSKKRRSRRDDDDDDDDEDDRPSRRKRSRRRSSGRHYVEHRGNLILILTILGIFTGILILNIVGWVLANNDLQEMDAGRMDPEGRSMTNICKIINMVVVILALVSLVVVCLIWVVAFGCIAGGAAVR